VRRNIQHWRQPAVSSRLPDPGHRLKTVQKATVVQVIEQQLSNGDRQPDLFLSGEATKGRGELDINA